jgi:hypothetical protein
MEAGGSECTSATDVYREGLSSRETWQSKALQWTLTHLFSAKYLQLNELLKEKISSGRKNNGLIKARWMTISH